MIISRKLNYVIIPILLIVIVIIFYPNNMSKNVDKNLSGKIKIISASHIFFGHQSVGANIITGLKELNSEQGSDYILFEKLNNDANLNGSYFVDLNIGNNGDPEGKFRDFVKNVDFLSDKKLNIAMMKLCFVDITKKSDIQNIFNSYVKMIDSLQIKYPNITFVHFTVPLKSQPTLFNKLKAFIKNRTIDDPADNIARNTYNELLISKYPAKYVFDIAKEESTYPDNKRESISVDGVHGYALIGDYSDDGGHLNKRGQAIIAAGLINKLSQIIH